MWWPSARRPRVRDHGRGAARRQGARDLPDPALRDAVTSRMFTDEHVFLLGCGPRTVRFRPTLTVTEDELDAGLDALERTVRTVAG